LKRTVVPFFLSHLGCPHACVFCDQLKISGAAGRIPETHEILDKIERYRLTSPGRELEVAFYGGTFTALPREEQLGLLAPLKPLVDDGRLDAVRLSTRPDAVDPETVGFLRKMGVSTVELGVQSLDDGVLALSGRGHTADDARRAVAWLKEGGFSVGVQLMTGLPGDSAARSLASLREALALAPSFLRIYPTVVIAGTELARLYREGVYTPQTLPEAVELCADMLLAARRAGVPVIRLGLQPTDELAAEGVILAGPQHPAFGQLVESELCFRLMSRLAEGLPKGAAVTFAVPSGKLSDAIGQGRENLKKLSDRHGVRVEKVREDASLHPTLLVLEWDGGRVVGDLLAPPMNRLSS